MKNKSQQRFEEKNGQWKGDEVGLAGLHQWVKNRLPKPELCQDCKKVLPYDLANISNEYKRDLDDWEWLCRSCHMKKDGRLEKLLINGNRSIKGIKQSPEHIFKRINATTMTRYGHELK